MTSGQATSSTLTADGHPRGSSITVVGPSLAAADAYATAAFAMGTSGVCRACLRGYEGMAIGADVSVA